MSSSEYHSTVHIISGWDVSYTTTYCAAVQFPTLINNGVDDQKVSAGDDLFTANLEFQGEMTRRRLLIWATGPTKLVARNCLLKPHATASLGGFCESDD